MSIYLLATLDTKGIEAAFVRDHLVDAGHDVVIVDPGCIGEPSIPGGLSARDISRSDVFRAAGESLERLRQLQDRGKAISCAATGVTELVKSAFQNGQLDGVVALGGSAGTTIGTAAMRALPIGLPKVMLSTLASGQVRQYVGDKDILMLNSVVDIAGLNRISRIVLAEAATAVDALAKHYIKSRQSETGPTDKPQLIAATMFGVTTPCVQEARRILEAEGFEVLVFHATGNGGQAMESLIRDGVIDGVLDMTTTELADELVGGILSAGPDRLTAAGQCCIPQVISVGATDMVNFGPRDSIPESFQGRQFYEHNQSVTLMRTSREENESLGREIALKASRAQGPTAVILPLAGVSAIDSKDQPFDDPDARSALFEAIRSNLTGVERIESNHHINDPEFAQLSAEKLIELIRKRQKKI